MASPLARRAGAALIVFAALSWIPWAFSEYHTHVFVISLYYVILAIGWNLLAGYAGQFSLAHHTFAGIGAYTSALLVHHAHVPIVIGIVAGVLVAAPPDTSSARSVPGCAPSNSPSRPRP